MFAVDDDDDVDMKTTAKQVLSSLTQSESEMREDYPGLMAKVIANEKKAKSADLRNLWELRRSDPGLQTYEGRMQSIFAKEKTARAAESAAKVLQVINHRDL